MRSRLMNDVSHSVFWMITEGQTEKSDNTVNEKGLAQ